MDNIIEVHGLTKEYDIKGKKKKVLDNISFHMKKGEILGICGKSGAGKTSLLHILHGTHPFNEGSARIGDVTLTPESDISDFKRVMRKTAIHDQRSFALYGESVIHNVMRKIRSREENTEDLPEKVSHDYGRIRDEAMEILKLVDLDKKALYYYNILSGGEKQRVLLARQLAYHPDVLLLDEPATMSDPGTMTNMVKTIKQVHEATGISIILVSHIPQMHEALSQRVLLLDDGRIVDEGGAKKVLCTFMGDMEDILPQKQIPMDAEPIIRLRNLGKRYEIFTSNELIETIEMKDINFTIPRGIVLGIIGPSARGKTVLMHLLSGIEKPNKGEVLYYIGSQPTDIAEYGMAAARARQKIGVLHQEFGLMHGETVLEMLSYRLGLKSMEALSAAVNKAKEMGIDEMGIDILLRFADQSLEEAQGALRQLGLDKNLIHELFPKFPETETRLRAEPIFKALNLPPSLIDRYSDELSMGEQIRVALALLMIHMPEILLLDEPFGDLDPVTLRTVVNSIKKLNREFGTTILFVSHHLGSVKELAHKAVLFDAGVLYQGSANAVCDRFLSTYGGSGQNLSCNNI